MLDFIKDAASKLGTDEGTAKSATGGMLDLIKQHAASADVSEMFSKLPGAEALLGAAPKEESGGGGLMGSIGGSVGGALTGALGGGSSALGALSALSKSGLSVGKIGDFASLFINYIKSKLGDGLVGRLVSKVPGLGSLVN